MSSNGERKTEKQFRMVFGGGFNNECEFSRQRKGRGYPRGRGQNGLNPRVLKKHPGLSDGEEDGRHQHSWEGWMRREEPSWEGSPCYIFLGAWFNILQLSLLPDNIELTRLPISQDHCED